MRNKFNHQLFYWHLELSSKCALKCPRCPRTEKPGMYKVTELGLNFIKEVFTRDFINQYVDSFLLCGGQGDPIYCKDFLDIVRYFKEVKPSIRLRITTNGSYKPASWWEQLAELLNEYDHLTFSVDGWDQESNNKYRVNSNFESISTAIRTMTSKSQARIRWSTILFRFNENNIDTIKQVAQDYGVDNLDITKSMLFGSYNESYIDPELGYDPLEPSLDKISIFGRHQRFTINFTDKKDFQSDIFKVRFDQISRQYSNHYVVPLCKAGNRAMYIDAEGILYPCSWVSHPFGIRKSKIRDKSVTWEKSMWVEYRDRFDLNKRSLEEVLNDDIWYKLETSWRCAQNSFVECEQKCHNKTVSWDDVVRRSLYSGSIK